VTITTTEAKEVVADMMAMTIKRVVIEEVKSLIAAKEITIFQKVARNNIK
jgi:ribosomal protein S24E